MQAVQVPHFTTAAAVLGACLIALPAAIAPPVPQHPVAWVAAADPIELTGAFSPMIGDLNAGDPAPVVDALASVELGTAEADPFTDFVQQISNYLQGALLLGILVFGGVVANVAQAFVDVYDWFAGIFGFEPYGVMDAAPALASDLGTALGDFTVPLGELIPAFDISGGAEVNPIADDAGIIGALVDSLGL
ncbi:hypothetical protein [Mycolicibacter minnesotensis]|nr:hypothetical protein [Mycolicibacter minnesotensis]